MRCNPRCHWLSATMPRSSPGRRSEGQGQAGRKGLQDGRDRVQRPPRGAQQTLEKWKEAYTEAATVARTKDAERAKFEAEANSFKASNKTCTDKTGSS